MWCLHNNVPSESIKNIFHEHGVLKNERTGDKYIIASRKMNSLIYHLQWSFVLEPNTSRNKKIENLQPLQKTIQ